MEPQLSIAQDKIGAAERQRNQLATKNQQLESELTSWIAASNQQTAKQMMQASVASVTQAMSSSSGIVPQVQGRPLQFPQATQTAMDTFGMGPPQQTFVPIRGELPEPRVTL